MFRVRHESTVRWVLGLLSTCFIAAVSTAEPTDTALVRDIYEVPIPSDPMALWDRVGDLQWLRRTADSKVLEGYLERTAVSQVLGEPIYSAPTLRQLLQHERTAPPPAPSQLLRVLGMFDVALDDSADEASVPRDYLRRVQYRYEGHSVWSQLRDPREAYLHVRFTNRSPYDIGSLDATVRIVQGSETIEFPCEAYFSPVLHADASAPGMCATVQSRSSARPGIATLINTAALVQLATSIEHGAATLSADMSVAFPQFSVYVSAAGVKPFNPQMRARTFPILTNLTCEDRDTCAAEREVAEERILYSPPVLGLIILLAGGATGFVLMRTVLFLGGGVRALSLARLTTGLVVVACIGIGVWNWCALKASHGSESLGAYWYFLVMLGAGVFGLGVLIAMFLVRRQRQMPNVT